MPDLEKVIKGLECAIDPEHNGFKNCHSCAYRKDIDHLQYVCDGDRCIADALALLKEQEARVMTLGDLRSIGSVWELNTPPYLWMEINPSYRWTRGFWVAWREIYDMIDGLHPTYDADNYQKIWRCWTSRPTDEHRQAVKWE